MTNFTRARKSTKRLSFAWTTTTDGVTAPFDLTGCTLEMLIDTERVESTPVVPTRVATIPGVITVPATGMAHFPITVGLTGSIQQLYFEVWVTDAAGETWPLDSGALMVIGGLK